MILNEMKGHIRNAIGYLRERPFGQDKIDNATEEINRAIESINHEENIYLIELDRFNIYNNNTNATETTIGINNAIIYAKENGYTGAKLPQGHYAVDTAVKNDLDLHDDTGDKWTCHRAGITMQTSLSVTCKGNKRYSRGTVSISNIVYTVTYQYEQEVVETIKQVYIGDINISNIKMGNSPITKVYIGDSLIWEV